MKPLCALDLPWKLLVTMFLIVLTSGFLVSEAYLWHTTEKADGKEGMGMDDITFQFHGDRESTTLKRNVLGGMRKYFAETGEEKDLTPEDLEEIEKVVAWSSAGAPESGYWNTALKEKDRDKGSIYVMLSNNGCYDCHAADADMKGSKPDSPLDTFANISKYTVKGGDTGMDKGRLLMISHVHLLGMGMMFLLVGAAMAATLFPVWLRSALIVGGLSSILFDIFGWWGVKWYGAPLAPVVMLGGVLMTVSFLLSVACSMYDLWIRKVPAVLTQPAKTVEPPVLANKS